MEIRYDYFEIHPYTHVKYVSIETRMMMHDLHNTSKACSSNSVD